MDAREVFAELSAVNVNEHVELKNRLRYLSWAWAWAEVKKRYPDAQSRVYEREDGCIYWTDGRTCWVKVSVTIGGMEHIEYLPVMDPRNQSIPLEKVTSMDVNKAIQRGITKAIARHGLGLYIYAGEDLPDGEEAEEVQEQPSETIGETGAETLRTLAVALGMTPEGFDGWIVKVFHKAAAELTKEEFEQAAARFERERKKR